MTPENAKLDHTWTDSDGIPLGGWVEVEHREWLRLIADAGGIQALTVFSSLTDPDGRYGPARVYTAWGMPGADAPLVDIRDYKGVTGMTVRSVLRKFEERDRGR